MFTVCKLYLCVLYFHGFEEMTYLNSERARCWRRPGGEMLVRFERDVPGACTLMFAADGAEVTVAGLRSADDLHERLTQFLSEAV